MPAHSRYNTYDFLPTTGFLLVNADHGSCRELVLARFDYNARVVRKAASSSLSSEKAPRIRSISEYWMVARLPVMITESINKPDPFALSLSTRTTTLLGCPARAMLLVIIATMVWGKPAPGWSAWTTSAGRRFDVRKFESGNKTKMTSSRRQLAGGSACPTCCIVGSHFRSIPVLGKRSQAVPQIGGLRLVDPTFTKIDRLCWMNPRHDDARTFGLRQRLQ